MKRQRRNHKPGFSRVARYQWQIKRLEKEVEKLKYQLRQDTPEYRAKILTEKDDLVVKLRDRILDLEKKLGNRVYQIFCSQHGFNFSYDEKCPECKEKKNATNTETQEIK